MNVKTGALVLAVSVLLCACGGDRGKAHTDWAFRDLTGEVRQVISRTYFGGSEGGPAAYGGNESGLAMYAITVFASDGRLAEEKFFNGRNELTSFTTFRRDPSGRIVEENSWTPAGELSLRVLYRYDERGRRTSEEFYDGQGARTGAYTYEYDAQDRWKRRFAETLYSDGSGRRSEVLYRYDAPGRLIEESHHEGAPGRLVLRIVHTYQGGRRAYSSHYQRGRWLEYRCFYQYDDAGNVVREASFQIPDDEDSEAFELLSREEQFPQRLASSLTLREYRYFQSNGP